MLDRHLLPTFGPMRMVDVLPVHVREWLTERTAVGVSPVTIRHSKIVAYAYATEIGAMVTPAQLDVVERHVADAVSKGARVLVDGKRSAQGDAYFEPTVLVDVDHTMACMCEETFGPTLPIMKVADEHEALRLANDSDFGLSSSIWKRDEVKADRLSRLIEAGSVSINKALVAVFQLPVPTGGWKQSGLGSRFGGANGVLKYCRQQTVVSERHHAQGRAQLVPDRPGEERRPG